MSAQGQQAAWDALVALHGDRVWAVAWAFGLTRAGAE